MDTMGWSSSVAEKASQFQMTSLNHRRQLLYLLVSFLKPQICIGVEPARRHT